jgi:hypothetical protein
LAVVQGSLMILAFPWLHLEVRRENVSALGNQLTEVGAIAFNRHLDATRIDVLRPFHNLDASPHGRDARILEPDSELGGLHGPHPPGAASGGTRPTSIAYNHTLGHWRPNGKLMEATLEHTPRALTDGRESVKTAEMRDQARLAASGIVTVVWRDEKRQLRYMRSLLRNISGGGALVLSFRPLPVGSPVRIRDANLFLLSGSARVRHCTRCGFAYLIGMKFDSDIAARFWSTVQEDVASDLYD